MEKDARTTPVPHAYLACGQGRALVTVEMLRAPQFAGLRRGLTYQDSPRLSDVLLVAGAVNRKMRHAVQHLSQQLAVSGQVMVLGDAIAVPWHDQAVYSGIAPLPGIPTVSIATAPDVAHALRTLQSVPVPALAGSSGAGTLLALRTDREIATEDLTLSLGPIHPALYGPLRLILLLDGEQVVKVQAEPGYAHRGIEKMAEGLAIEDVVAYGSALDGLAPLAGATVLAQAAEAIAGLRVPPRALLLRVIVLELERIASHLFATARTLRTLAMDGDAAQVLELRLRVATTLARLTGDASLSIVAGGVAVEPPKDALQQAVATCRGMRGWTLRELGMAHIEWKVERRVFERQLTGVGRVAADTVLAQGLSGPVARGAGVALDARAHGDAADAYRQLGFQPVVEGDGDALSRYRVRIMEIAASAALVEQAVQNLPDGDHRVPFAIDPANLTGWETQSVVESPRGLLGAYLTVTVEAGRVVVERLRLRAPSWLHYSVLPGLLVGHRLPDALVAINSLDIAPDEAER